MRPQEFLPLFQSVETLAGVGARMRALLAKALELPHGAGGSGGAGANSPRVIDLLWHLPSGLIDRRARPRVREARPGQLATLAVRVIEHRPPPSRHSKAPYRVLCADDSGEIALIFFRGDRRYLERALPVGAERLVSGRIERYRGRLQMPHPDHIAPREDEARFPFLEPVYPLTAGLGAKALQKAIAGALERVPQMPEWQDAAWLEARGWPGFNEALLRLHRPETPADVSNTGPAWQRLAYDELLANQLALAIVRRSTRAMAGRPIVGDGRLRARIADALPFKLTASQRQALAEIAADMAAPRRMLRLLQGDVGSGKTIVALMAMAIAVEAGAQAALMAPTEVLARQHLETIGPLAEAAGLKVTLLTGREKGRARRQILTLLADGHLDMIIGTHALFQPDVVFADLALAVIDEQHRFGVHQRLALQSKGGGRSARAGGNVQGARDPHPSQKGASGDERQSTRAHAGDERSGQSTDERTVRGADVLVMTATPIPRTLLMTHYGDLDVSRLTEKPAGRKPVTTRAVANDRIEEVILALKRAIEGEGAQAYWVCPLVEGSDKSPLAAAEERHGHLKKYFGSRVGLIHGQMASTAKDEAMARFQKGEIVILVATTVIEVGVDVPNASIIVIEHAERFGLAQLHQLRGRVGRGRRASSCILLYQPPLGETARARLETMRATEDGFVIAEEDLRLRGGGELMGTRQSGLPEFRIARIPNLEELLMAARDDARLILARDPELKSERGAALRRLLYLFECDEAVRLFRTG